AFGRRWADASLMSGRGNYPARGREPAPGGADGPLPRRAALKSRSASEPSRRKMRSIGGDGRSGRGPRTVAREAVCGTLLLHAAAAADPLSRAATIAILIRQKAHEQLQVMRAPRRCALAAVAPQQRRNASPQRRNASLLGARIFCN